MPNYKMRPPDLIIDQVLLYVIDHGPVDGKEVERALGLGYNPCRMKLSTLCAAGYLRIVARGVYESNIPERLLMSNGERIDPHKKYRVHGEVMYGMAVIRDRVRRAQEKALQS